MPSGMTNLGAPISPCLSGDRLIIFDCTGSPDHSYKHVSPLDKMLLALSIYVDRTKGFSIWGSLIQEESPYSAAFVTLVGLGNNFSLWKSGAAECGWECLKELTGVKRISGQPMQSKMIGLPPACLQTWWYWSSCGWFWQRELPIVWCFNHFSENRVYPGNQKYSNL